MREVACRSALGACALGIAATLYFQLARAARRRGVRRKAARQNDEQDPAGSDGRPTCPFGFTSENEHDGTGPAGLVASIRDKQQRVTMLYEEYIHLDAIRAVWSTPKTENPQLEPVFAAAMHAIEIGVMLMAIFVRDNRAYVTKRQRIDAVARCLEQECILVADLVDASSSEDEAEQITNTSRSLSQAFPFPNCPPTVAGTDGGGAQSACLAYLIDAVRAAYGGLEPDDRRALRNVVRNISSAFDAAFSCWSVGVGVEEQLNVLRCVVGLHPLESLARRLSGLFLDYKGMVRPEIILATYQGECYRHSEDFFFRSIHLATECWSFVALQHLRHALRLSLRDSENNRHVALHQAASLVRHAALIIEYMGSNIMTLRCMNLRDYLELKVKEIKPAARRLLAGLLGAAKACIPDAAALCCLPLPPDLAGEPNSDDGDEVVQLMAAVYMQPELYAGLHAYAKALELLESSVLGGFYYKHYSLAVSVIGTASRGTMNRSVAALKHAYETALFPSLDAARTLLGRQIDARLTDRTGRIMAEIEQKRLAKADTQMGPVLLPDPPGSLASTASSSSSSSSSSAAADSFAVAEQGAGKGPGGCSVAPSYSTSVVPPPFPKPKRDLHAQLYGDQSLNKKDWRRESPLAPAVLFLQHSFGQISRHMHACALEEQYALFQRGDAIWQEVYARILPEFNSHVQRLLHLHSSPDASPAYEAEVQVGHNTFDLVSKLLSARLVTEGCLHVLTTDAEFYSFNRQMKQLVQVAETLKFKVQVKTVPAHPIQTFPERFAAALSADAYNVAYVSQCTFKMQQTLLHDVSAWAQALYRLAPDCWLVVDGCHAFCAIDTDLSHAPPTLFYTSTLMKHAGCGANAALMLVPKAQHSKIQPLWTGWMADLSVLRPLSPGVCLTSIKDEPLAFEAGSSLAGGTPAFIPALLVFNLTMRSWQARNIKVKDVHDYTMSLHDRFYQRLSSRAWEILFASEHGTRAGAARRDTFAHQKRAALPCAMSSGVHDEEQGACARRFRWTHEATRHQSLTVSLPTGSAAEAAELVCELRRYGIVADCRGEFVRFGMGACHSVAHLDMLVEALEAIAAKRAGKTV